MSSTELGPAVLQMMEVLERSEQRSHDVIRQLANVAETMQRDHEITMAQVEQALRELVEGPLAEYRAVEMFPGDGLPIEDTLRRMHQNGAFRTVHGMEGKV